MRSESNARTVWEFQVWLKKETVSPHTSASSCPHRGFPNKFNENVNSSVATESINLGTVLAAAAPLC